MSPLQREKRMGFALDALIMGYIIPHEGAGPNPCFGIDEGAKWRWILSLRRKNAFMRRIRHKMLTAKELGTKIPRGAWCITGGYQKFFWQLLVHFSEAIRQGFRITGEGVAWHAEHGPKDFITRMRGMHGGKFPQSFCFPVVVMGGAQSQQATTPYVKRVTRSSREAGIPTESYADDRPQLRPRTSASSASSCALALTISSCFVVAFLKPLEI